MTRARVVVPCYNEALRLDREAFLAWAREPESGSLLLVDDGSSDGTWEVLQDLSGRAGGRISALRLPRNRGKAEAVRQGLLAALEGPEDYVGYWDADLSTPLDTLRELQGYLDAHPRVDLLLGSRVQLLGKRIDRQALRHYVGRIFATAASETLGLPVYDTQCGAKMFRASDELRDLLARPFLSNWSFDVEILARFLQRHGRVEALERIHEYPLPRWRDVAGSKVRPWHLLTSLWDLVRIRLRYLSGRRGPSR